MDEIYEMWVDYCKVVPRKSRIKFRKWMRSQLKYQECKCCGSKENLSWDHIRPKVFGNTLAKNNRQILCKKCNWSKGVLSINYNTKTFILEPWILKLEDKDMKSLFRDTDQISAQLFCTTSVLNRKYKTILYETKNQQ
jgi:hypothetical protein